VKQAISDVEPAVLKVEIVLCERFQPEQIQTHDAGRRVVRACSTQKRSV
jgi:hypothetical protein